MLGIDLEFMITAACKGLIQLWKSIILPVVAYGCETWSLTLREGNIKGF
jgi:hypothetical protein